MVGLGALAAPASRSPGAHPGDHAQSGTLRPPSALCKGPSAVPRDLMALRTPARAPRTVPQTRWLRHPQDGALEVVELRDLMAPIALQGHPTPCAVAESDSWDTPSMVPREEPLDMRALTAP